jgi:NTP pyrophosphatase (non-canonical NTP hydrolase)
MKPETRKALEAVFDQAVTEDRDRIMLNGCKQGWALCLADMTAELRASGCRMFTDEGVMELIQAVSAKRPSSTTAATPATHPLALYVKDAMRTESRDFGAIIDRMCVTGEHAKPNVDMLRLLHFTLGLLTETGEFADGLKKCLFYGKPLDKTNLKEEFGDLNWYLAGLADVLDGMGVCTWPEALDANIRKLKARYPNLFTEQNALHRDVKRELNEVGEPKENKNNASQTNSTEPGKPSPDEAQDAGKGSS